MIFRKTKMWELIQIQVLQLDFKNMQNIIIRLLTKNLFYYLDIWK